MRTAARTRRGSCAGTVRRSPGSATRPATSSPCCSSTERITSHRENNPGRTGMHRVLLTLLTAAVAAAVAPATAQAADARFATFNASLNRGSAGQLVTDLSNPSADTVRVRQARNVAEVIQRAAPDVLLVNE